VPPPIVIVSGGGVGAGAGPSWSLCTTLVGYRCAPCRCGHPLSWCWWCWFYAPGCCDGGGDGGGDGTARGVLEIRKIMKKGKKGGRDLPQQPYIIVGAGWRLSWPFVVVVGIAVASCRGVWLSDSAVVLP
jgi:hypothetical protein